MYWTFSKNNGWQNDHYFEYNFENSILIEWHGAEINVTNSEKLYEMEFIIR